MTAEKYPFTITPSIIRYLEEAIRVFESKNHGMDDVESVEPFSICFTSYEKHEPFQDNSESTRKKFIEYLEQEGAVKLDSIKATDTRPFDGFVPKERWQKSRNKYEGDFETNFVLLILDMKPIYEIWNDYVASKNQQES